MSGKPVEEGTNPVSSSLADPIVTIDPRGGFMELRARSPLTEAHALLVGQRLDGWPEVEVVDEHGVATRAVTVRFSVVGESVTIEGASGNSVDRETTGRGWAYAEGLYGLSAGPASVAVSLPASPGAAVLTYSVNVVAADSSTG